MNGNQKRKGVGVPLDEMHLLRRYTTKQTWIPAEAHDDKSGEKSPQKDVHFKSEVMMSSSIRELLATAH
jgi:hypothetical protein